MSKRTPFEAFMDWLFGAIVIGAVVAVFLLWTIGTVWCIAHDHSWWALVIGCAGFGACGSLVVNAE